MDWGRKLVGLAVATLGLRPGVATAAGVVLLWGQAPEAGSRGLASVARAHSIEAFVLNPAGLARIEGHHLRLGIDWGFNHWTVDRQDGIVRLDTEGYEVPPEEAPHPAVTSRDLTPAPVVGYAMRPGSSQLTLAVAFTTPHSVRTRDFGEDSPLRYMIIENELRQGSYEVGAGWVVPGLDGRLAVGASLGGSLAAQRYVLVASADPEGHEDPAEDARVELQGEDWFAPTYSLGVELVVAPQLTVAASFRAATNNHILGSGTFTPRDGSLLHALNGGVPLGFDVAIPVRLPQVFRVGVRYDRGDFDLELDAVWSRWSQFGDIVIHLSNPTGLDSLPQTFRELAEEVLSEPIVIEKGYRDVPGFALGGCRRFHLPLEACAGVTWQPRAARTADIDAVFLDLPLLALAAGVHYRLPPFTLHLGARWMIALRTDVEDNRFESMNLVDSISEDESLRTVVGNGRYQARYFGVLSGVSVDL